MTRVFTAHGIGTIVNTVVERGRTSHLVEGDNFKLWLAAKDVHEADNEGAALGDPMGGSLFSMSYTPDRFLDPGALAHGGGSPERDFLAATRYRYADVRDDLLQAEGDEVKTLGEYGDYLQDARSQGDQQAVDAFQEILRDERDHARIFNDELDHMASKAFDHDPAWHVNESNSTVLPYDPSPQNDANTVPGPDGSWGPGEYAFDPKRRLSPSDSRTQGDRRSPFKYPGPDPKLFAASVHEGEGRHRAPENPLDPFIDTLDRGALPELVPGEEGDPNVYLKRTWPPKPRGEHFAPGPLDRMRGRDRAASATALDGNGFISAQSLGLSDRYADIQAGYESDPFRRDPLAFLQRRAAVLEGYTGLDPATGEYMNLVLADKEVRRAAWRDVSAKAKRLQGEGRVRITAATPEAIHATVAGDGGIHHAIIVRGGSFDLGGRSVTAWHCDCSWGQWAHKRNLTHVGQMCPHAYASYMQMQAGVVEDFKQWAEDGNQPMDETSMNNFITRPRDEDDDDEPPLSEDEVSQLYDYVREHPKMSPQREFDVPYTFDQDKVYKDAAEAIPGLPTPTPTPGPSTLTPDQFGLGGSNSPGDDAALGPWGGSSGHGASVHRADALRMTPRSMTPDLQFVPEGEPEHFVDVTEDDRKTTGPGQIMHGSEGHYDDYDHAAGAWEHQRGREEDPEIEHFGSLFYADAEQHDPREPQARPDAGEAAGDLNKLRDLMAEPTEDHFGDMRGYNDDMRGLVDDLHDAGVDASPLTASRHHAYTDEAVRHFHHFVNKRWNGDVSHNSLEDYIRHNPNIHPDDVGTLLDHVDRTIHHSSLQFTGGDDDDFLQPAEGSGAFAGSGPDPKWWFSTSEDYVNEHERPNYQDVTTFPDGDILKYNDDSGPVTSPREAAYRYADEFSDTTDPGSVSTPETAPLAAGEMSGADPLIQPGDDTGGMTASRYYEGAALASLLAEGGGGSTIGLPKPPSPPGIGGDEMGHSGGGGLFGDLGKGMDSMGPSGGSGTGGGGGGDSIGILPKNSPALGGGDKIGPSGGGGDEMGPSGGAGTSPGGLTGPAQGAGGDDFVHPSAGGTWPGGAGFGDTIPNMGTGGGAGAGDMMGPSAAHETFANRRQRVSMEGRPSILDGIRRRQMHGYDTTTLPPGWGDVPPKGDDEDPLPDFPGEDSVDDVMDSIPGVGGGGMPGMPKGMGKGIPKVPVASRQQDHWPSDGNDIVRQFQASQGAQVFARGGGAGGGRPSSRAAAMGQYGAMPAGGRNRFTNDDIAGAAASFLQRTAGRTYSMAEQQELMDEMPVGGRGARNLGGLDLTGTHYVEGM